MSEGKIDRCGRLIGEIYIDKMNVNKQIIPNGYGWQFLKYSESEEYLEAELQARAKKEDFGKIQTQLLLGNGEKKG